MTEEKDKNTRELKELKERVDSTLAEYKEFVARLPALAEALNSIVTNLFGSMSTHVNHVVTIGYAGFFGIWAFSREYMSPASNLLAALFMLVSIVLFVSGQIFNVIAFNRASASLWESDQGASARATLERADIVLRKLRPSVRKYEVVRPWVLNAAILFAVAAVLIMVVGLVSGLYDEYTSSL